MSAFGFAERLTVRRLHQTVQRNIHSRHQQQARFDSSTTSSSSASSSSSKPRRNLAGNDVTRPPRTIPVSGWQWVDPILEPFRAYGRMQQRSPYTTQLSTTLTIYFLGDLSAQTVSSEVFTLREYEPIRGVRAMIIGGLFSIPGYKWFIWLGRHFNYSSWTLSISTKILINQTFFTPFFNTYFFGMQTFLTGGGWKDAKRRVVETVPISWKNSWKVWPAVTAFTFTFVPEQYRNVFAGVIAIGWQTYLSWINQKAEAAHEKEMEAQKRLTVAEAPVKRKRQSGEGGRKRKAEV